MREQSLISEWKREEQRSFRGWDFSHLRDRYFEATPPWSYECMVLPLLRKSESLLDMGTGGGEKLLEFRKSFPPMVTATEGYPPNLVVARNNLEPHGVNVIEYDLARAARMPFPDESFSLVINRHEAFEASEVARILKPGGSFLVQQCVSVGDLSAVFGMEPQFTRLTLTTCVAELKHAGLTIELAQESIDPMRFTDVGAIVYFVHACPWEAPADFSVDRYRAQLLELHTGQRLSFNMRHFIIQARKAS